MPTETEVFDLARNTVVNSITNFVEARANVIPKFQICQI